MHESIVAAIIGAGATLFAALAGFTAVVLQISKQGRLNRQNIIESQARAFKLDVYHQGLQRARAVADAAVGLIVRLETVISELKVLKGARSAGMPCPTPRSRYVDILNLMEQLSSSQAQFSFFIENNRILDRRITIFRSALSTAGFDLSAIWTLQFPSTIMRSLPVDNPSGGIYQYDTPDDNAIDAAILCCSEAMQVLYDFVGYAEDFMVEIQNLTMGDVFLNKVDHRVPSDNRSRVIRLDDEVDIENWIATTNWGKYLSAMSEKTPEDPR